MNYSFVRRYNPAYDFFLIRYFNQGGIEFDDKVTYTEIFPRWIFASSMKNKSPHEKLFSNYISNWRFHPEARPDYYEIFDRAIGGKGWPEIKRLKGLELELGDHNKKLVFSSVEVANVISEFYRRYMRVPLKPELEGGHGGKEILKYFSTKELQPLIRLRQTGDDEENERERNRIAGELLLWFGSMTPSKIESEIERVLKEHEEGGEHLRAPNPNVKPEDRVWSCYHELEFVELESFRQETDAQPRPVSITILTES